MSPPRKRSLTLQRHSTSVSLEDEFWDEFRRIARELDKPINALAAEIDTSREAGCGLASAIRLFVLRELKARAATSQTDA